MRGQQRRKGCRLLGYYEEVFSRVWMVRSGHLMCLFWFFGDDPLEQRETRFKLQLDRGGIRGRWHNPQVMPARVEGGMGTVSGMETLGERSCEWVERSQKMQGESKPGQQQI